MFIMEQDEIGEKILDRIRKQKDVKTTLQTLLLSGIYPEFIVQWSILYPDENKRFDMRAQAIKAISNFFPPPEGSNRPSFMLSSFLKVLASTLSRESEQFPLKITPPYRSPVDPKTEPDIALFASDDPDYGMIPCHKLFIGLQSEFFKLLFHTQMVESGRSEFGVCEISGSLLFQIVQLCYGELTIHEPKELLDLLVATDRFQMGKLKTLLWTTLALAENHIFREPSRDIAERLIDNLDVKDPAWFSVVLHFTRNWINFLDEDSEDILYPYLQKIKDGLVHAVENNFEF